MFGRVVGGDVIAFVFVAGLTGYVVVFFKSCFSYNVEGSQVLFKLCVHLYTFAFVSLVIVAYVCFSFIFFKLFKVVEWFVNFPGLSGLMDVGCLEKFEGRGKRLGWFDSGKNHSTMKFCKEGRGLQRDWYNYKENHCASRHIGVESALNKFCVSGQSEKHHFIHRLFIFWAMTTSLDFQGSGQVCLVRSKTTSYIDEKEVW